MAPHVEALSTTRGIETTDLAIDLTSAGEFDVALLDERLLEFANPSERFGDAKFIVVGDKLIVFNGRMQHNRMYESLEHTFGITGKLQCAGAISFNFTDNATKGPQRKIYDHSVSLDYLDHKLTVANSDRYKKTKLREILGEYFVIE
jgi:hypothetical protein